MQLLARFAARALPFEAGCAGLLVLLSLPAGASANNGDPRDRLLDEANVAAHLALLSLLLIASLGTTASLRKREEEETGRGRSTEMRGEQRGGRSLAEERRWRRWKLPVELGGGGGEREKSG